MPSITNLHEQLARMDSRQRTTTVRRYLWMATATAAGFYFSLAAVDQRGTNKRSGNPPIVIRDSRPLSPHGEVAGQPAPDDEFTPFAAPYNQAAYEGSAGETVDDQVRQATAVLPDDSWTGRSADR